jgi:hypothetical protein
VRRAGFEEDEYATVRMREELRNGETIRRTAGYGKGSLCFDAPRHVVIGYLTELLQYRRDELLSLRLPEMHLSMLAKQRAASGARLPDMTLPVVANYLENAGSLDHKLALSDENSIAYKTLVARLLSGESSWCFC